MLPYGAIEAGGTKFICGIGTGPHDLETTQFPTTTPETTLAAAIEFFRGKALQSVGIASFGPVDLREGRITSTPKSGWRDTPIAAPIRRALGVSVGFDTDVNGAALAEGRWGAAQGLSDFVYLTVGTGIGGGAVVNGKLVHGMVHTEMGHVRVPRDPSRDAFPGVCPFHGDCLEGLASGPAMQARWGRKALDLPQDHPAWALEAHYLALGMANFMFTLSPRRIVAGGGVMQQEHLFGLIREELSRILNGYIPQIDVVPPRLGGRAGVLGGLILAEQAAVPAGPAEISREPNPILNV